MLDVTVIADEILKGSFKSDAIRIHNQRNLKPMGFYHLGKLCHFRRYTL